MEILVKNMVCPRCIESVRQSLDGLEIRFRHIELGKVRLENSISEDKKELLAEALQSKGFELLESKSAQLISQIKSLIISQIHHHDQSRAENFSTLLSEKLNQEYTSLSRLFSQVEGLTIEKFTTRQKIERVKELLLYDEKSLTQIAFELNYSSAAYLSSQFKKETGMTPSEFKRNKDYFNRKGLDQF
ncbi:helix-turn-helix domain-containing protein [Algoriphagus litoralis]|uniref:helix-turn-helix domain-containing protein n=1 Tax=Algoriphagus litoralis TaxID=2202829 RepID=UPI000DB9C4C7|nr:AraC family transcriptional regulator [Algoriphagus litoralis]